MAQNQIRLDQYFAFYEIQNGFEHVLHTLGTLF